MRSRRWIVGLVGAAVLLEVLPSASASNTEGPPDRGVAGPAEEAAPVVDGTRNIGGDAAAMTSDGGTVWVGRSDGTVVRVPPVGEVTTRQVAAPIRSLVVVGRELWVSHGERAVSRLDATTLIQYDNWTKAAPVRTLAAVDGLVWGEDGSSHVARVDERDPGAPVDVGGPVGFLTADDKSLVVVRTDGWVVVVDVRSGRPNNGTRVDRPIVSVAGGPARVPAPAAPPHVWVATKDGFLIRVDGGVLRATLSLGGTPVGVAAGRTLVWVALDDGRLLRVDPATGAVRATALLDGPPAGLLAAGDNVWAVLGWRLTRLRVPYGAVAGESLPRRRPPADTGRIHGELSDLRITDEVGFDRLTLGVIGREAPGLSIDHAGYDVRPIPRGDGVRGNSFLQVRLDLTAVGDSQFGPGPERVEVDGAQLVEVVRTGLSHDSITWTLGLRRTPAARIWTSAGGSSYCHCLVVDVG